LVRATSTGVARAIGTQTANPEKGIDMSQPLNGAELIAALPIYAGHDAPDCWVIAVKSRSGEYVSAQVKTLADPEWYAGHYFDNAGSVVADVYVRVNESANAFALTDADFRAIAAKGRIS
jgi:hypothetical protein